MYPMAFSYLRELKDLSKVAEGSRHYLFHPMWGNSAAFDPPGMTPGGVVRDDKFVLNRTEKEAFGRYCFRLYEHFDKIHCAKLFFRATGLGPYDRIEVDLNGTTFPIEEVRRIWHAEGRHESRGRPLPAYTTCLVDLSSPPVVEGDNFLGVKLIFSGVVGGDIVIDEVEVTVIPNL